MSPLQQQQHVTCYRFGSVGEDTHICLWDMTEDTLKKAALSASSGAGGADLNTSQSGCVASVTRPDPPKPLKDGDLL